MKDEQVVKIYDTITVEEKEMFIVMEYCDGGNLLQWIKRSRRHKLLNQTVGRTFESHIVCSCEHGVIHFDCGYKSHKVT